MTDHEADLISIAASYLPEGYVIVPVEPTEKIIDALWKVVEEDKEARISNVYRAMIQAAQEEE